MLGAVAALVVVALGAPELSEAEGAANESLVPVVVCPTTFGIIPSPQEVPQPMSSTVPIAASLARRVALYGDDQASMRLLAPRGWHCTAEFGADGSGGVQVYPPTQPPPSGASSFPSLPEAVLGLQTSVCVGCTQGQACPLFTQAATAYHRDFMLRCPLTRPARETVHRVGPTVVGFTDPPGVRGDGLPSGGRYTAYGVMTYSPEAEHGSWLATCTLPPADRAVCAAGLGLFARWYARD